MVTVPYGYTLQERQAVAKCAEAAGFHVVQIISQPSAACLAYGLGQIDNTECFKCVVYQCGGHSLTVSVAQVNGGMMSILKCMKFGAGGDQITGVLADYLATEFQRKHRMDPRESKRSKLKLKMQAETVKHILSTLDTSNCYIESLCEGIDFSFNVTRARFENELSKILTDFLDPIHTTLAEAGVKSADIEKVIFFFLNAIFFGNSKQNLIFSGHFVRRNDQDSQTQERRPQPFSQRGNLEFTQSGRSAGPRRGLAGRPDERALAAQRARGRHQPQAGGHVARLRLYDQFG